MKQLESGILYFEDALAKVPLRKEPLVALIPPIMAGVHSLYRMQVQEGFYPRGVSSGAIQAAASEDPRILSPYTLVREQDHRIEAFDYTDPSLGFAPLLRFTADAVYNYIAKAKDLRLPEAGKIDASLGTQADCFMQGNFSRLMATRLNMDHDRSPDVFFALLDRYQDRRFNRKLSAQGWAVIENPDLTANLNGLMRDAWRNLGHVPSRDQIIAGDLLFTAGLSVDKDGWSGNTIPSEEDLRLNNRALVYIFDNNFKRKFASERLPALEEWTPDVKKVPGWESKVVEAAQMALAFHEFGHARTKISPQVEASLKDSVVGFKELAAEEFGYEGMGSLNHEQIDQTLQKLAVYSTLSKLRRDIASYHGETDPQRKQICMAYAQDGAAMLNYLESHGAIRISEDNGQISVPDFNKFFEDTKSFAYELRGWIENENVYTREEKDRNRISIAREFKFHVGTPRNYLDSNYSRARNPQPELQPQPVSAA